MQKSYIAARSRPTGPTLWAAALAFALLPLVASAPGSAEAQDASRRFAPNLTAFCKKYFPSSRPRFSQARLQWVCARNVNGRVIHQNILMDVACSMTEKDARYGGQLGQTPFCLRAPSSGDAGSRTQ